MLAEYASISYTLSFRFNGPLQTTRTLISLLACVVVGINHDVLNWCIGDGKWYTTKRTHDPARVSSQTKGYREGLVGVSVSYAIPVRL